MKNNRKKIFYFMLIFFSFLLLNISNSGITNASCNYDISVDGIFDSHEGYDYYFVDDSIVRFYLDEDIFDNEEIHDIVFVETGYASDPHIISKGDSDFGPIVDYQLKNEERELKKVHIVLLPFYNGDNFEEESNWVCDLEVYLFQIDPLKENSFIVQVDQELNENDMFEANIFFEGSKTFALDSIEYSDPQGGIFSLNVDDRKFEILEIGTYSMTIEDVFGNSSSFDFLVGFDTVDEILISSDDDLEQVLGFPKEIGFSLDLLTQGVSVINNIDQETNVQWLVNGSLVYQNSLNNDGDQFLFTPPSEVRDDIRSHFVEARILSRNSNELILEVANNERPVVSLNGESLITLEADIENYVEYGAEASDDVDGNISDQIIIDYSDFGIDGLVEVNQDEVENYEHLFSQINESLGEYRINYYVFDSHQNMSFIVRRTVNIVDTIPPIITLLGEQQIEIPYDGEYIEFGATAYDEFDGDLTDEIEIESFVNTSQIGEQSVFYNVEDSSGNSASKERIVIVYDDVPPEIELLGDAEIFLEYSQPYIERGARVSDIVDGTFNIFPTKLLYSIDGEDYQEQEEVAIDTNVLGFYKFIYEYSDSSGNKGNPAVRNVIVQNTTPPEINILISNPLLLIYGEETVFNIEANTHYEAYDVYGNNISEEIVKSGDVNIDPSDPNYIGTHNIFLDVEDEDGNFAQTKELVVFLIDTTEPVISLDGSSSVSYEAIIDEFDKSSFEEGGEHGFSVENVLEGVSYGVIVDIEFDNGEVITEEKDIPIGIIDNYIDTNNTGVYTLYFEAINIDGNRTTLEYPVQREILIQDTTPPTISFKGDEDVVREVNSSLNDLLQDLKSDDYIEVEDEYDDAHGYEIDVNIIDYVDTRRTGEYVVFYSATDSSGNTSSLKRRNIIIEDTSIPHIELIGEDEIFFERGNFYEEDGARIFDEYEGVFTISPYEICITGWESINEYYGCVFIERYGHDQDDDPEIMGAPPNGMISGIYHLTYNGRDSSGNFAEPVTRILRVESSIPPTVDGFDEDRYYYNEPFTITFEPPEGTDATYTAYLNGEIRTSPISIEEEGEYNLLVVDDFGNEFYFEFVLDMTPPEVRGINDGEYTNRDLVTIYGNKPIDMVEYLYEGLQWATIEDSSATFSIEGDYQVRVRDLAGNWSSSVRFTIDRTPPNIFTSFDNRELSEKSVEILSALESGLTITINGEEILEDEYKFVDNNFYRIHVIDRAGNELDLQFTLNRSNTVKVGDHEIPFVHQIAFDPNNTFKIPTDQYAPGSGFVIAYPRANDSFEFISVRSFREQSPNELGMLIEQGEDLILTSNVNTSNTMAVVFVIEPEYVELLTPEGEEVSPYLLALFVLGVLLVFLVAIGYRKNAVTTTYNEEFEFEQQDIDDEYF